jgi:hypothetical protein
MGCQGRLQFREIIFSNLEKEVQLGFRKIVED